MSREIKPTLVTIQPCHCEPFSGEAISHLSGQLDRLGKKNAPHNDKHNSLDARLNSYPALKMSEPELLIRAWETPATMER